MLFNGTPRWVWKLNCRQDDGLKLFLSYFYDDYRHYHTTEKVLFALVSLEQEYSIIKEIITSFQKLVYSRRVPFIAMYSIFVV